MSGTTDSLLYDSLAATGSPESFQQAVAVCNMMWPLAAALSSIISGYIMSYFGTVTILYQYDVLQTTDQRAGVDAVMTLSTIPVVLALLVSYMLTEADSEKEPQTDRPSSRQGISIDILDKFRMGYTGALQHTKQSFQ